MSSSNSGTKITRRKFVQTTGAAAGALALGAYVRPARSEERVLNWLTYPGHGAAEVVGPFEERYGVKIRAKEYSGGERMLALIHGSPPGSFDLVTSDAPYVEKLRQAGFIEPMDPSQYPLEEFWPEFQKWAQHWLDGDFYAVMTSWGFNGLAYNANVLSESDVSSYRVMWREDLKGKVGMRQWYLPVMGCFSLHLGHKEPYNITDGQFAKLKETMFSVKPQVKGFWDFAGVFDSLANEVAYVVPGTGDWMTGLLQRDGHPIRSATTDEGAVMWTESASIVGGTKKKELCQQFIRYLTSPEGQIRLMTKSSYMASGPSRKAWEELNAKQPQVAEMINMNLEGTNLMDMLRKGRIVPRKLPAQQSIEEWQQAYTEFQNL